MQRKTSFFEKIGSLIPGYKGYSERDSRRDCDKVMRNLISNKFGFFEKKLNEFGLQSFKKKDKEKMQSIELVRKELNTLKSKIEYAPYGASSFFADNQIKEDELFEIYQFDHDLLELSEKIVLCEVHEIDELSKLIELCSNILRNRNEYIAKF